ncbi:lytic polysaccharide monooxygenase [Nocardia sp. NBC_01503]|uniref:lytic polysaccharide monooxygenase n=1 Tax=Nocardia sp. NBC_01503 TaxID=2975997 RepID=UPI002E7AAF07|nr:lytic polysaccharide monooxygenase [Nocardia sp. NBC_01503]WTL34978.1 lytic polysaccharide monooxygenase [Nocardia sp. NBC_01503]
MFSSRRPYIAMASIGLTPFLIAILPGGVANAHGYVSSPLSRQAQCVEKIVSCGEIQYEPQSVEGPKGLRNCSANIARFADLDDDSKGWRVQSVDSTATFSWTFTALHRTLNWEYYIGNTRVGVVDGNNQPPPDGGVTHTIDLSGFSGRQKLIAVWNIGDTANAFYSCLDLQIGGGSPGTTTPPTTKPPVTTTAPPTTTKPPVTTTAPPTSAPHTTHQHPTTTDQPSGTEWRVGAHYAVGDVVTYQGGRYRCLQAHTVYDPNWMPTATPALWQRI